MSDPFDRLWDRVTAAAAAQAADRNRPKYFDEAIDTAQALPLWAMRIARVVYPDRSPRDVTVVGAARLLAADVDLAAMHCAADAEGRG